MYQIGRVFRDGPIKLGRYREFWQCDLDIIGTKSMLAEAELLAAVEMAFNKLNLSEVVSFTTVANLRSMAVMQKIGMCNSGQNFMHPNIEASHPQCEHVLYKISKSEWHQNVL